MMDAYSVGEGVAEVSVCILIDMEIERSVVVEIRTQNDTATGKNIDVWRWM